MPDKPHLFTRRRTWIAVGVVGLTALLFSCGTGRQPVYPVHGRVLDDNDQPAAGAVVMFHPVGPADPNAKPIVGRVDETGAFRLTTYTQGDGAPTGEYAVTVFWQPPRKSPFDPPGPDKLKGSGYGDPNGSKIPHFHVQKQPDNEVPTITLKLP
jgi:hypothetical protein